MSVKKKVFYAVLLCFFFVLVFKIFDSNRSNIGLKTCKKKGTDYSLNRKEALQIAKTSDCSEIGFFLPIGYDCNEFTGTWWFNIFTKNYPGCSPACVVNVETKIAEINYRCTGISK